VAENGSRFLLAYELYSWKAESGDDWEFALKPTTNRRKTPAELFDASRIRGLDSLDRKLGELEPGTTVVWFQKLMSRPGVVEKGAERLRVPPKDVVAKVKEMIERHELRLQGLDPPAPNP
jgi:hypothetical protein